MPKLLAVEWDAREARVAVAQPRAEGAIIEHAFVVDLGTAEGNGTPLSAADIGARIQSALAARRVGKVETLVAVGRASIELKLLSMPPAPDDELAEMVRFQAQRDFDSLSDDWPLDYLPLSGGEKEPRSVLAAAISPELVQQIDQTCRAAQLKPMHLVLRPCASAALLKRCPAPEEERTRLLVDLFFSEADLTVMVDRDVVFMRTVRLPAEEGGGPSFPALLGEIRRTIAAVQNQLSGLKVDAVYLCGRRDEHTELLSTLEAKLGLPTHVFQPLAGLQLGAALDESQLEHPDRFAPLLGMLLEEAEGQRHAIDFLNPRRRPAPQSQRRTYVLAAAAACAVVLGCGWWLWSSLAALDTQISELTQELIEQDKFIKRLAETEQKVAEIDKWAKSDVSWLDELLRVSNQLPPAQEAMLLSWRASPIADGGQLEVEGLVRSAGVVDDLEDSLRDGVHRVDVKAGSQETSVKPYGWRFKSSIQVAPGLEEVPAKVIPPGSAAPATAAQKPKG